MVPDRASTGILAGHHAEKMNSIKFKLASPYVFPITHLIKQRNRNDRGTMLQLDLLGQHTGDGFRGWYISSIDVGFVILGRWWRLLPWWNIQDEHRHATGVRSGPQRGARVLLIGQIRLRKG